MNPFTDREYCHIYTRANTYEDDSSCNYLHVIEVVMTESV